MGDRVQFLADLYKQKAVTIPCDGFLFIGDGDGIEMCPPQMAYTRGEKLHGWYKTVNRCAIREVKSARDAISPGRITS